MRELGARLTQGADEAFIGAVPAGLVSVIVGVLDEAGFPYWFLGVSLPPGVDGAVFGMAAVIGPRLWLGLKFLRFFAGRLSKRGGTEHRETEALQDRRAQRHEKIMYEF